MSNCLVTQTVYAYASPGSGLLPYQVQVIGGDPSSCVGSVVLSPAEYLEWQSSIINFGFDQAMFEKTFAAGLTLFVIGLGIGLLISMVRKTRI